MPSMMRRPGGRKRMVYGANITPKKEPKPHKLPRGGSAGRTHHHAKAMHHVKKAHHKAKKGHGETFATLGDALKSVGLLE